MMDLTSVIGYLSGIYFIRPDIEPSTLIRTAALIHLLDALLCHIIAYYTKRPKALWTLAGMVLGIWALGPLFVLAEIKGGSGGQPKD